MMFGVPDSNFDLKATGKAVYSFDRRFEGNQPVSITSGTSVPDTRFGNLGCGSFARFWWKR